MKSHYLVLSFLLLAACQPAAPPVEPEAMESMLPPLTTRADSLAFKVLEMSGGEKALRSVPYLRFDFGTREPASRSHLWDRMTGDYRVEYLRDDTTYVVLFNTQTREGSAYKNGAPAANSAELVERAYGAFINDTYWLMMPAKMLDPGVSRAMVPDSSDATHEVIRLSFDNVGLTPGDNYYVWVNRETGWADRWHYVLQSGGEQRCEWTDYTELEGPAGPIWLSKTKVCSRFTMRTDALETPLEVPEGTFVNPAPMMQGT